MVAVATEVQRAEIPRRLVLRVAGKGRAENETATFPLPHDVLQALRRAAGQRSEGPLLLKSTGRAYVRQSSTHSYDASAGGPGWRPDLPRTGFARPS